MVEANWVIQTYKGDWAKSVRAHADAGIGYFIKDEGGKGGSYTVVAAFKRAGSLTPGMEFANDREVVWLDEHELKRNGH